jgi:hypothetical protein
MNIQQPMETNNEIKRTLFIDSRDMINSPGYKSPFDFIVRLEDRTTTQNDNVTVHQGIGIDPYKHISKMQLKMVGIPKMDNREHYVILDIPEINDHLDSTDRGSHRASAIINYDSNSTDAGTVNPTFENFEFSFTAPMQVLSQMNIRLLKHGGDVISHADFGSIDINILHTTLTFEVTYNPNLF